LDSGWRISPPCRPPRLRFASYACAPHAENARSSLKKRTRGNEQRLCLFENMALHLFTSASLHLHRTAFACVGHIKTRGSDAAPQA
jgi:hypothetical protein